MEMVATLDQGTAQPKIQMDHVECASTVHVRLMVGAKGVWIQLQGLFLFYFINISMYVVQMQE